MSDIIRETGKRCRNWGRWGPDDERGTLNYITPEAIVEAARLVRRGAVFSLAIPFDAKGPQIDQPRRFNPIHRMMITGPDCTTGAIRFPSPICAWYRSRFSLSPGRPTASTSAMVSAARANGTPG